MLIHDMLDYAQLSGGQFRKLMSTFNLIKTIEDIVKIMKFKASELGIKISIDVSALEQ